MQSRAHPVTDANQPSRLPRFSPAYGERASHQPVAGGVSFGAGWALGGLCPGPGIVTVGMGSTSAAVWLLSMVGGRMVGSQLERFDPTKKKALTKGH